MKMKRLTILLGLFLSLSGLAFGQIDLQPVAIVRLSKSQPISVKEFKDYVNWMSLSRANVDPSAKVSLTADERREILDTLSNQLLACQAAEQESVTVTDKEVNQQFDEEMKPLVAYLTEKQGRAPSEAEVDTELRAQTGMTRGGFKEQIRRSLVTNKYLQFKKQALFQAVKPPTDGELQTLYNQYKDKNIFEGGFVRPDAVRIRMIWVPVKNASEKTAALNKANQLLKNIGGDAGKFDEIVTEASKPNSGYLGGDGPYIYKHEQIRAAMGLDFYDTAFRLKQGEVSKLLERPDGYYIVKVIETYRQKTLTLDDIYNLGDPRKITVRNYITIVESQRRQMETIKQASEELVAELKKRGSVQVNNETYNSIVW
jgi:parvulin-like peptidyl-prolyl isomerase